jgi:hypothetical protein
LQWCLAADQDRSYVKAGKVFAMQPTLPQQAPTSALPIARLIVWTIAVVVGALAAAAAMLWVHYGTAVFYEMILSGIAACF